MRTVGALLLLAALLSPGSAMADRTLPSWSDYHASRTIQQGWRAAGGGDLASADRLSARAVALTPDSADAWRLRLAVLVTAERWADARDAATRLTALVPEDLDAAVAAGRVSLELGARPAAVASFRRAAELNPTDPRPDLGLALVAARLDGDWTSMTTHLQAARLRDDGLDLASLPLQPGWTPVADDAGFLDALGLLLQQR